MISVFAFVVENPVAQVTSITLPALFSVVWLGLIGSGLAFIVFFRLIKHWGATRTSLVAYVMPIWGIVLGAVVLGEVISAGRLSGTALVIAGIALVNLKREQITGGATALRAKMGRREPQADVVARPR
jgi:drug/metabolite transporter (DMT)-like permease